MIVKICQKKYFARICHVCCKSTLMSLQHINTQWKDFKCQYGCGTICQVAIADGVVTTKENFR